MMMLLLTNSLTECMWPVLSPQIMMLSLFMINADLNDNNDEYDGDGDGVHVHCSC